jgi:hypothetical protein
MAGVVKEKKAQNMQYLKDKMSEKVKGIFHFHERPGGTLDFDYKFFKGQNVEQYHLNDGERCEIPLGVARHLCTSGRYPIHEHKQDENGKPSLVIGRNVARYSFESLEFTDLDLGRKDELIPEVTRAE